MRKICLLILLLVAQVSANYQNNPSFYKAGNSNPKALNGYKSGLDLSGMSIFSDFNNPKEKPYGLSLFSGGLSAGYIREDMTNFYSLGYGMSISNNHILSAKYTTDFSQGDEDHFDVGLMLAYRYLNLGFNVYDVAFNTSSWTDGEKAAGATAFLLDRNLFVSTYSNFNTFDIDKLDLTNSIGYNFSKALMVEGYLGYNTSDFSGTRVVGVTASALLTKSTQFDFNMSVDESTDDGYNSNGAFVFFTQKEVSKPAVVKKYITVNFPSKFIDQENMFNKNLTYHTFFQKMNMALRDPSIKGLLIKLPSSIREGLGVVENFRTLIEKFKGKGKEVHIYLESGGVKEFYLASVADSVYLNPSSYNIIKNPYLETIYYKGLFDKLGIKFEYIRYAKYKSAIEPYAMDSMSIYARANKKELIDDMIKNLTNKKIDFNVLTKRVLITPKEMIDSGYVDDTLYWDQVVSRISKKGLVQNLNKFDYRTDVEYSGGKIAVVNFKGAIIPGRSRNSMWGSSYVGSESFTRLMGSLERNSSVKGIIIKMNSPGGSAVASDIIYHSIDKIDKPIYTYIESVGASGGYYAACGSDKIYASPSAIVGSIGIYAGKVDLNGLFDKLGLKNEKVMSGERDDIFSVTKTWEEADYDILNSHLRYYYDRFLTVVAKNRKMTLQDTENVAGGRIYSGTKSSQIGLVDEISDLSKVIEDMKKEVGGLNVGVSFVTTSSLSSKLMNSFVPSLHISETMEIIDALQEEQVFMVEPNLVIE